MLLHLEGKRACGAITTVAASCLTGLNSQVHMQSVTQTLHTIRGRWERRGGGVSQSASCLSPLLIQLRITITAQVMLGSRGGQALRGIAGDSEADSEHS